MSELVPYGPDETRSSWPGKHGGFNEEAVLAAPYQEYYYL